MLSISMHIILKAMFVLLILNLILGCIVGIITALKLREKSNKYNRTERRLMGLKRIKVQGMSFEIKKITPADYLNNDNIPVTQWEVETRKFMGDISNSNIDIIKLKNIWKNLFIKAIVSISGQYENIEQLIDKLLGNMTLSGELYSEIVSYCLGIKKKKILGMFPKKQY